MGSNIRETFICCNQESRFTLHCCPQSVVFPAAHVLIYNADSVMT